MTVDSEPRLIIDGGANAGYASVFFANKYKDAMIVAVEPDVNNVDLLRLNTQYYDNISIIQAGLWHKTCYLKIKNPEASSWAFQVQESTNIPAAFKAVTIDNILADTGFDSIDILKLDIEGAEKKLFSEGCTSWLGKVKVLIIELHDYIKPGCSFVVNHAVSKYNYKSCQRGEKIVFYRAN